MIHITEFLFYLKTPKVYAEKHTFIEYKRCNYFKSYGKCHCFSRHSVVHFKKLHQTSCKVAVSENVNNTLGCTLSKARANLEMRSRMNWFYERLQCSNMDVYFFHHDHFLATSWWNHINDFYNFTTHSVPKQRISRAQVKIECILPKFFNYVELSKSLIAWEISCVFPYIQVGKTSETQKWVTDENNFY